MKGVPWSSQFSATVVLEPKLSSTLSEWNSRLRRRLEFVGQESEKKELHRKPGP